MTNRRILPTVAVAAGLAYAFISPIVRADPDAPAATAPAPKKKPAAPAKPKQAPKPAPAPKEPTKKASPEPTASTESPKPRPGVGGAGAAHEIVEHESRIEFDERMVRGQSAAGAIFLFQRTPSDLKSIVEVPTTFRPKTVEMIQPHRGTP